MIKVRQIAEIKAGTPWDPHDGRPPREPRQQYRIYDIYGLCPCMPASGGGIIKILDTR